MNYTPLPTVDEARTFLSVVNRGRKAIGLEPLKFIDFDNASPCSYSNCLSARNLFYPADLNVGGLQVESQGHEESRQILLADAIA